MKPTKGSGLQILLVEEDHQSRSERELTTFRRIAIGRMVKEIAFGLGINEKTVATYVARIPTKTSLGGPGTGFRCWRNSAQWPCSTTSLQT